MHVQKDLRYIVVAYYFSSYVIIMSPPQGYCSPTGGSYIITRYYQQVTMNNDHTLLSEYTHKAIAVQQEHLIL